MDKSEIKSLNKKLAPILRDYEWNLRWHRWADGSMGWELSIAPPGKLKLIISERNKFRGIACPISMPLLLPTPTMRELRDVLPEDVIVTVYGFSVYASGGPAS